MNFSDKAIEILNYGIQVTSLAAVPCLTGMAYRSWAKRWKSELPRWRSSLGLVSIITTSLGWLAFVSFFLAVLSRINLDGEHWLIFQLVTLILGIPSAFTLRSPSRAQILLADLFMILLLGATVNI